MYEWDHQRERERGRSRDRLFGRKIEPWQKEKRKDVVEMSGSGMIYDRIGSDRIG